MLWFLSLALPARPGYCDCYAGLSQQHKHEDPCIHEGSRIFFFINDVQKCAQRVVMQSSVPPTHSLQALKPVSISLFIASFISCICRALTNLTSPPRFFKVDSYSSRWRFNKVFVALMTSNCSSLMTPLSLFLCPLFLHCDNVSTGLVQASPSPSPGSPASIKQEFNGVTYAALDSIAAC
ncbi:hypothetical protein E6O75_ATG01741 [Venturia nashicola]|uniref:Secreted protein n=1 Tax=Venturia nashicola TaxID=86259 RepID=A0A4Z1NLV9_9PEZI|nr:hypothetical protein E6O75_ATG01741 [Venturia nashicola]